jgi:hypothetical protein
LLDYILIKPDAPGFLTVSGKIDRHRGRDQVAWIETRIRALESQEALQQQPGSGQQHERQRHFANNQHVSRAPQLSASGDGPASFFERGLQVRPRSVERRSQAKQNPGQERDRGGEQQDGAVHPDLAQARHAN